MLIKKLLVGLAFTTVAFASQAAEDSGESSEAAKIEQMEKKLEDYQKQLDALTDSFEAPTGETAKEAGRLQDWISKMTIGGYGEVHYNNLENQHDDDAKKDRLDIHRFVLFFGYQFTEDLRFFSEFEIEHSLVCGGYDDVTVDGNEVQGDPKCPGEVEMEQAFVEWDFAENWAAMAGVFLLPIGILNETHEPTTYYGVERNNVEKYIIPTTWWEGGLGLTGEIAPALTFGVMVTSGLEITAENTSIRYARQKVAEANAQDLAYTARLKYTGVRGLTLATSIQYQSNLLQGETLNGEQDIDAILWEANVIYNIDRFSIEGLYAQWNIDSGISTAIEKEGSDKQNGWYVQPSVMVWDGLGLFIRYSEWDTQAGNNTDSEYKETDFGLNYWMTEHVVLKADYQIQNTPSSAKQYKGYNLGIGWAF